MKKILYLFIMISTTLFAADKRVLVEIFTNSHCPLCPAAHSALDNFLASENGDKIEFIYYHLIFPYSDDQLFQDNPTDSQDKNAFYGPYTSTPKAHFDGIRVSNSYSNWGSNLNDLLNNESIFDISLSGNFDESSFTINAEITKSGSSDLSEFTVNYVVVEDVFYNGRNGISSHKNIMREIVNPEGDLFSINDGETKTLNAAIDYNEGWNSENVSIIVFIQNKDTKEVFQSASIDYSSLVLTDVQEDILVKDTYSLEQNYPNPFNPATTIKYSIPVDLSYEYQDVRLVIYDIIGRELAELVNEKQKAGNYEVEFDGSDLTSGIYFYRLQAGNYIITKKMTLLK